MFKVSKYLFYSSVFGLCFFELLNVYFVMPMPGSQQLDSIDIAYFLYTNRWLIRTFYILCLGMGSIYVLRISQKWIPFLLLIFSFFIFYLFNFKFNAENLFKQPTKLELILSEDNHVKLISQVIVVENNGDAKAYPIAFIAYHHQVQDSIGDRKILVTYCSVCRTGRVYEPIVEGHAEKFRLVGMNHFNAMLEDETTESWWMQSTGEAITGILKGKFLNQYPSRQMTIEKFYKLYPLGKVMQPDANYVSEYDSLLRFEEGRSKSNLIRTDTASWNNKSWVIGIQIGDYAKAYDWKKLKEQKIINDSAAGIQIFIALSSDEKSFVAFENNSVNFFKINNDTLISGEKMYDFSGTCLNSPSERLRMISAYQEFWHSWKFFHPNTVKYF